MTTKKKIKEKDRTIARLRMKCKRQNIDSTPERNVKKIEKEGKEAVRKHLLFKECVVQQLTEKKQS